MVCEDYKYNDARAIGPGYVPGYVPGYGSGL